MSVSHLSAGWRFVRVRRRAGRGKTAAADQPWRAMKYACIAALVAATAISGASATTFDFSFANENLNSPPGQFVTGTVDGLTEGVNTFGNITATIMDGQGVVPNGTVYNGLNSVYMGSILVEAGEVTAADGFWRTPESIFYLGTWFSNGGYYPHIVNYQTGETAFSLSTVTFSQAEPPAVPEPTSWAMMLTGFGAIGGAMRSRRRRAAACG